jgi:hypothetical protein
MKKLKTNWTLKVMMMMAQYMMFKLFCKREAIKNNRMHSILKTSNNNNNKKEVWFIWEMEHLEKTASCQVVDRTSTNTHIFNAFTLYKT